MPWVEWEIAKDRLHELKERTGVRIDVNLNEAQANVLQPKNVSKVE